MPSNQKIGTTFNTSKWLKASIFILLLGLYASLLAHRIELPVGDDLARHLKNGELILQGRTEVFYNNFYSYSEPNREFINHHWLSGVIFYFVFLLASWPGLVLFKILILLSAFSFLFFATLKKTDFWLTAVFSIPAIILMAERTSLRPEIFSFLFAAIFLYLLADLEQHPNRNRIFWLAPLQLLWVNLHLFFVLGPVLVAGWLFEKLVIRRKENVQRLPLGKIGLLLVALVVICLANPNGVSGALYPFRVFENYGFLINENQSLADWQKVSAPMDNLAVTVFKPAVWLVFISFLFNFRAKPIFYFLASVAFAAGGFMMIRLLSFFGVIFLPAVAANFSNAFAATRVGREKFFAPALLVGLALLNVAGIGGKIFPDRELGIGLSDRSDNTADFFKDHNLKGPIFNDFDIGSYLIYHLYPEEKVFVDNRPEAYSEDFFKNTYSASLENEARWREILSIYGFNVIVFYQYDDTPFARQFMYRRAADPSWSLVFADPYALIFLKNTEENKQVIDQFRITPGNAEVRLKYLLDSPKFDDQVAAADIFNLLGRTDLALLAFSNVVSRWPEKSRIWMILGEWELEGGDAVAVERAIAHLEKAVSLGQKTAEAYSFLGYAYRRAGQLDKAVEVLQKALKINPERQDDGELMEEVRGERGR